MSRNNVGAIIAFCILMFSGLGLCLYETARYFTTVWDATIGEYRSLWGEYDWVFCVIGIMMFLLGGVCLVLIGEVKVPPVVGMAVFVGLVTGLFVAICFVYAAILFAGDLPIWPSMFQEPWPTLQGIVVVLGVVAAGAAAANGWRELSRMLRRRFK